jgi:signal transduction histidine kinase
MKATLPDPQRGVAGAPSLLWVGISLPIAQGSRMVACRTPLYGNGMTPADLTSRRVKAAFSALWSAPSWRATRNMLAAFAVGLLGGLLLGGLGLIWVAAIVSLIGWPVGGWAHAALYMAVVAAGPVLALWAVQGLSALQRSRLRATLGVHIPAGSRAAGRKPWPVGPWLAAATWRQLGFHLLAILTGVAGGGLVAASWLAPVAAIGYLAASGPPAVAGGGACLAALGLLLAAPWLARQLTRADEASARALLGPSHSEELTQRLEALARSRADLVAAADAERRRIERDLHDGAQQRLVSLAMNLGLARERFTSAPEPVRQAIAEAHDEAVLALSELREFIRGLYPAVLNDRGLDAALSGLAARAPLPVRLRVDVPRPASPSVEAVAYFIVSEALTNVAKHAQATRAEVTVIRRADVLRIAVTDDGSGGAVAAERDGAGAGSGLRGLAQRAAAVDGTLTIDSPPGGPTVIAAELPCES